MNSSHKILVITALSHYHASKSIKPKDAVDSGKPEEHKENSFVFDESSLNGDVCPNALRMAHVKESLACHEEAQRLQRMCRDLKVRKLYENMFLCSLHDRVYAIKNIDFVKYGYTSKH